MHHPLGGTYLGCGGAHATIVLEAARNAEEDYRKHRDGHHHPSNAGRDEPASAQGSAGGWRAHPTVSSTVLSCPFSHNTTLQHYRLLSATATVTNEKIQGELPRNPISRSSPPASCIAPVPYQTPTP